MHISSFDDLWALWPRPVDMAADLGISLSHLRMMRVRRSIPVRYWERLAGAADRRGLHGVTYGALVRLHIEAEAA